jgi:hypothetical protein
MRKQRWYNCPGTCVVQSRELLNREYNYGGSIKQIPTYQVPQKNEIREVLNILVLTLKGNPGAKVARLGPFSVRRVEFVYGYEDPEFDKPPKPLAEYNIEVK